jgi:hypothetical protein
MDNFMLNYIHNIRGFVRPSAATVDQEQHDER